MLPPALIAGYQASRAPGVDRSVLCHAPFVSLNFERSGNVTSCCYNRSVVLGSYPHQTLAEMWKGAAAREFREAFLRGTVVPGCALCFHQLQSSNFAGTLMRNFDEHAMSADYAAEVDMPYPRVLEFEIANTCNLECVMCDGRWSSAIRARREQLPPLRSPYDQAFVDQLEPFLPHVAQARFLGGEPFLIRRYYDIWERLIAVNPDARVTITTNGSFLPERARAVLEGMRAHIVVSLDAVTSPLYESIRRNARLDVVLAHVEYLVDYTRRAATGMSLAVCPMTYNWHELEPVVRFAQDRGLHLHFNTVTRPYEASLVSLSPDEHDRVLQYLDTISVTGDDVRSEANRAELSGLQQQVRAWRDEKQGFAARAAMLASRLRARLPARMAERLAPGLASLARCYLTAHELRNVSHWDLRHLLPQPPLVAWPGDSTPAGFDLVYATQLLHDLLGAERADAVAGDDTAADGEAGSVGAAAPPPVPSPLLHCLDILDVADPSAASHVDATGTAILSQLATADIDRIEEALCELLRTIGEPSSSDRVLDDVWCVDSPDDAATFEHSGFDATRLAEACAYALRSIGRRRTALAAPPGQESRRDDPLPFTPHGLRVRLDALYLQLVREAAAAGREFRHTPLQLERVMQRLLAEHDLVPLCREIDATEISSAAHHLDDYLQNAG